MSGTWAVFRVPGSREVASCVLWMEFVCFSYSHSHQLQRGYLAPHSSTPSSISELGVLQKLSQ